MADLENVVNAGELKRIAEKRLCWGSFKLLQLFSISWIVCMNRNLHSLVENYYFYFIFRPSVCELCNKLVSLANIPLLSFHFFQYWPFFMGTYGLSSKSLVSDKMSYNSRLSIKKKTFDRRQITYSSMLYLNTLYYYQSVLENIHCLG